MARGCDWILTNNHSQLRRMPFFCTGFSGVCFRIHHPYPPFRSGFTPNLRPLCIPEPGQRPLRSLPGRCPPGWVCPCAAFGPGSASCGSGPCPAAPPGLPPARCEANGAGGKLHLITTTRGCIFIELYIYIVSPPPCELPFLLS